MFIFLPMSAMFHHWYDKIFFNEPGHKVLSSVFLTILFSKVEIEMGYKEGCHVRRNTSDNSGSVRNSERRVLIVELERKLRCGRFERRSGALLVIARYFPRGDKRRETLSKFVRDVSHTHTPHAPRFRLSFTTLAPRYERNIVRAPIRISK